MRKPRTFTAIGIYLLFFGLLILVSVDPLRHLKEIATFTYYKQAYQGTTTGLIIGAVTDLLYLLAVLFLGILSLFTGMRKVSLTRLGEYALKGAGGLAILIPVIAVVPCILSGGALCGVWGVVLLKFLSPLFLLDLLFVLISARRPVLLGVVLSALVAIVFGAVIVLKKISPTSAEFCASLMDPWKRLNCYQNFAEYEGHESHCEKIEEHPPSLQKWNMDFTKYKDTCYLVVARKRSDGRICARIQDVKTKENCLKQAQHNQISGDQENTDSVFCDYESQLNRHYVSKDSKVCAVKKFGCPPADPQRRAFVTPFSDDCGCGCEE